MYSMVVEEEFDGELKMVQKSCAAGVKKSVKKQILNHQKYLTALNSKGQDQYVTQMSFRSKKHEVRTIAQKRVGLTAYDDKRYVMNDHSTKAYGNSDIPLEDLIYIMENDSSSPMQ